MDLGDTPLPALLRHRLVSGTWRGGHSVPGGDAGVSRLSQVMHQLWGVGGCHFPSDSDLVKATGL